MRSGPADPLPASRTHAYDARAIRVVLGANLDDPIGAAEDCEPGDIYRLDPQAPLLRLLLRPAGEGAAGQRIAEGSEIGAPGDTVTLAARLTLMAPDAERVEILYLRHDASGRGYAVPLSPIVARTDYTLIEVSAEVAGLRIADIVCVSFAAGTLITLPDGRQRPVEALAPGDLVLTRDHGAQPVRWIGKATLRARGGFAPVTITAGTLGNLGDLVVSPHHRLFIYQRQARKLGDTAELLVQAKHLVDGERVIRREGGFVDYYSLVFDRHEIIYAEGIPSESLMVNDQVVPLLPAGLAEELRARFPGLSQSQHFGHEVDAALLDEAARRAILRGPDRS